MANVKPTYINSTGGYPQPVSPNDDSIAARALYLQTATSNDTACGVERDASNNLLLRAGSSTRLTLDATTGAATVAAPISGTTALTATGFIQASASGFRFADGTIQTSSAATIARVTSTYTTSSTSYINIPALSLTVAANTNYAFVGYLMWQLNGPATTGVGFGINGPASPTLFDLTLTYNANGAGTAQIRHDVSYNAMAAQTSSSASNTTYVTTYSGIISTGSSGGTFAISMIGSGSTNFSVMPGSFLALRVIGS